LPVDGEARGGEYDSEQDSTHDCAGAAHPRNGQTPIEIVSAIWAFLNSVHWHDIVAWPTVCYPTTARIFDWSGSVSVDVAPVPQRTAVSIRCHPTMRPKAFRMVNGVFVATDPKPKVKG
jgi:hypothetical protein